MTIDQKYLSTLNKGDLYSVKWSVLQRNPDYIVISNGLSEGKLYVSFYGDKEKTNLLEKVEFPEKTYTFIIVD